MPIEGKEVVRAFDEGVTLRANLDNRIDLMAPYVDPTRFGVQARMPVDGQSLMTDVYDSTGIFAADLLSNYIMTHVANPAAKWFGLRERRDWLNEDDEVREWMEEVRDLMLKDRASGNFYSEGHQVCKDWSSFGTSDMIIEEGPMLPYKPQFGYRGTRWTCHRIGRFIIYRNGWHQVDRVYTDFMLNASGAVERFGKDQMPESVLRAFDAGKNTELFRFIHGVFPRANEDRFRSFGNKRMPFASVYVEYRTKAIVRESGYPTNPHVTPTWSRVPEENWGRGRAEIIINDALTLSTVKRLELEELALVIRPPWFAANDSVFGSVRLNPGQMINVRMSGGRSIKDLIMHYQSSANWHVTQIKEEKLREAIMEGYFVQAIKQAMAFEGTNQMTATEYVKRISLLNKIVGAVYPTMETEWLKPDVDRQFDLMMEAGALPEPPDILLEQGGEIDVVFENPLARAQKIEEIDAMDRMLTRIGPMAELQVKFSGKASAEVLDNFPFDEWVRKMAEIEGVPASLINSDREVAVLRGSRAEAEQKSAAGQQALMLTEGIKNIAPALKALEQNKKAA